MPGTLTLCATPIGNLGDAAPRLAEALRDADVIYAEDTRRARRLIDHFDLTGARLRSYFVGNEQDRAAELADRLAAGDDVALITDAGTPSISDPGLSAVRAAVSVDARVTIVPGPSAVTGALAVSGLPADQFVFAGFPPRKGSDREVFFAGIEAESRTTVLFSARSRVARDLADLANAVGFDRTVVVVRELTKLHEEVFRGTAGSAAKRWEAEGEAKGEFTVVVAGADRARPPIETLVGDVLAGVAAGGRLSDVARDVADLAGVSRRELYQAAIRTRDGA